MDRFVRAFTLILALVSAMSGIFLPNILSALGVNVPNSTEASWVLVLGMPILLTLSFMRLNLTPASDFATVALQSIAQLAIFIAPFWWLASNAQ